MFGDKKLGFGCMRLPLLDAGDPTKIDLEQTEKMVDLFLRRASPILTQASLPATDS